MTLKVLQALQSLSMLISTLISTLIPNLRAFDVNIFALSTLIFCRPLKLVDVYISWLSTLIFLTLVTRPVIFSMTNTQTITNLYYKSFYKIFDGVMLRTN